MKNDAATQTQTLPTGVYGRQSRRFFQRQQQKSKEGLNSPWPPCVKGAVTAGDWGIERQFLMTRIYGHQKRRFRIGEQQKSKEGLKPLPQGRGVRLFSAVAVGCRPRRPAAVGCTLSVLSEVTLNAAREAMLAWYTSVAPALFPFMALMPMLTSPAAARGYERLLGRLMQFLFNLPGAAAPAVVVGMIAGSPAGAVAAVRTCAAAGLTRADAERLTMCCCGLSPAFLITGVGAAMLGNPADGTLLLRAQILTQLTLLAVTRRTRPSETLEYIEETD